MTHIVSATGPFNDFDIADPKHQPQVVIEDATRRLAIGFESQIPLQTCLDMPIEHPKQDLSSTSIDPTYDHSN